MHLLFLPFLFVATLSFADEMSYILESPRALGRGGARLAANDSDEAIKINPAALAESKVSFQLKLFDIDGFTGKNVVNTISDIVSTVSDKNSDGFSQLRKFNDKFDQLQYIRLQASLFSLRILKLELTPFFSTTDTLMFESERLPKMSWLSDTIAGVNVGYGYEIFPWLDVGMNFKPFYRWHVKGGFSTSNVMDFATSSIKFEDISPIRSGFGLGVDLGTILKPIANHRFAVTIHNLGYTNYVQKDWKLPPPVSQNIGLGYMYRRVFFGWDLDVFADLQDIENRQGKNLLMLTHAGVEYGKSVFSRDHDYGVTLGMDGGAFSAGLFADLWFMRIDFVNYTKELGYSPGQFPDNRYAITLRSSITF